MSAACDAFDRIAENLEISLRMSDQADAVLVVDSTIHGTSSGGVRITEDVSREEVHALAREMTLKYSFFGLRRGGAKCGIRLPGSVTPEEKAEALREFGRHLRPIIAHGLYYPGMDMNCSFTDLQNIYKGAGYTIGDHADSSYYTAMSVAQVLEAVRAQVEDSSPLSLSIAGFGRVAWHLIDRLDMSRYRLVGFSTATGACYDESGFDPAEVLAACREHGDAFVTRLGRGLLDDRDGLYACPVDILLPAARTDAIHSGNVGSVDAGYIVPIANKPYTDEALRTLEESGVACFPGYVCNGGGVFASGLADAGVPEQAIEGLCAGGYRAVARALFAKSLEGRLSLHEIARTLAHDSCLRLRAEQPGRGERLLRRLGQRFGPTRAVLRKKLFENLEEQFTRHVERIRAL
ncbi:Glu/Leu/Phe/Val dehydrogenase [Desulfovibrio sp. X2]|uniref:Glu/Leu/Phe/Val dehydrogenase dimerization domain-containing protein n=1 Tax=Desulfovibrio sp. X2 TaxID=941449 RepID=UPI0003589144|nr:Glu/Leu/Phe/Val dehydrogenase dimerization domain-containing protein [Desulfovibrio sp. X2]EPR37229.1 Glu/Leu/Phe/Val dehydrogenase [Desulfovibrio sp. X2]